MTAEQLDLISIDPAVMHGQAVISRTRIPVSVVLDCLAAGMSTEEILAEYPTLTGDGVARRRRLWRASGQGGTVSAHSAVKVKLDKNMPASAAEVLVSLAWTSTP